ncbi:MAG: hypothetical protein ACRENG_05300 [bacterium]
MAPNKMLSPLQALLRKADYPADVSSAGISGWTAFQNTAFIESYSSLYFSNSRQRRHIDAKQLD